MYENDFKNILFKIIAFAFVLHEGGFIDLQDPTILHICPPGSSVGEEAVVAGEKFAGLPDC